MLILTRRVGEAIKIGNDTTITVLGIQGGQVRIGFDAPKDVSVHREEIYTRIQQEKDPNYVAPEPSIIPEAKKTSVTIRSRNRFWANSGLANAH